MFDENISGELPEHMDFVKNVAIPKFQKWGYQTQILHHNKTYMDYFNHVRKRGNNVGKRVGFPMPDKCNVRNCKVKPIECYIKSIDEKVIQYIGYAADEPLRLQRLDNENKISLLARYGITQQMAAEKCEEYNLLSPYYKYSKRGGCWFCPNAGKCQLKHVRNNHKELWTNLLDLENENDLAGQIWNTQSGMSIHKMNEILEQESNQITIEDFLSQIL